jgi:hypothetical protein
MVGLYAPAIGAEAAQADGWWRRADELIETLSEGTEHGLHAWFAGCARGDEGDKRLKPGSESERGTFLVRGGPKTTGGLYRN